MVSPCPSKNKNDEFAESDLNKSIIKATSFIYVASLLLTIFFCRTGASRRKTITQPQVLFGFKKPPCRFQTRNTDKGTRWGKCTFYYSKYQNVTQSYFHYY